MALVNRLASAPPDLTRVAVTQLHHRGGRWRGGQRTTPKTTICAVRPSTSALTAQWAWWRDGQLPTTETLPPVTQWRRATTLLGQRKDVVAASIHAHAEF